MAEDGRAVLVARDEQRSVGALVEGPLLKERLVRMVFAAVIMASIPVAVLYIFFNSHFVEEVRKGHSNSALKSSNGSELAE